MTVILALKRVLKIPNNLYAIELLTRTQHATIIFWHVTSLWRSMPVWSIRNLDDFRVNMRMLLLLLLYKMTLKGGFHI